VLTTRPSKPLEFRGGFLVIGKCLVLCGYARRVEGEMIVRMLVRSSDGKRPLWLIRRGREMIRTGAVEE
jgi:hypothetical protein